MKLSSIIRLYRARLRARVVLVQEAFTVLGIAVGVALLFASQVASASLNGSVDQLTSGVVGKMQLQMLARDPHGFDESLLRQVRGLAGVRAAVPVLEERANVIGATGHQSVDLIGSDPRFASLAGPLLRHFSAAQLAGQEVLALPNPLAREIGTGPLRTATLQVSGRDVLALVGTVLDEADIGALVHSSVAIAPLAYAQRITGMQGRLTRIFVQTQPGREQEIKHALTRLANGTVNVEQARFDATVFSQAAGPTNQSMTLFSAISALVGFMFAFTSMLLTVHLRESLVADLRLNGATRAATIKVLLFDALVLGVLACALGIALGELLSVTVFTARPGYLTFAFPVGSLRVVSWRSVAVAGGAGLLAACVGVLAPLRDVLARPLRNAPGPPRNPGSSLDAVKVFSLSAGLLCLGITTVVVLTGVVSLTAAIVGVVSLVASLLLLLPRLIEGVVWAFSWAQSKFGVVSPRLAVIELQSASTRTRSLAIAATGAIAVFGGVAVQGARGNLEHGLDHSARDIDSNAAIWVAPTGAFNTFSTTPFKSTDAAALARLPGVAALHIYRGGFLDYGIRRLWVLAPPSTAPNPIPPTQLAKGNLALATTRLRAGGWIAISQAVAAQHHLRIGDTFSLPSPRPTVFRIAALLTNLGWPPGAVILNASDYARAWGSADPSAYQLQLQPGTSADALRSAVKRSLGPNSGLTTETSLQREQRHYEQARDGLGQLTEIRTLVLIAAILAMSIAMAAMIWQRRPALARIKMQGLGRGVLWRALLWESVLLLGAGCSIGALFGLYSQLLQSHALANVTGFPVVISVRSVVALTNFAIVTVAAVAIVAWPGYRATSVRPSPNPQG